MARNPLRDKLAVVGVGSTPYGRDLQRTSLSLGLEAALKAIEDAGIDRQEIDGLCGSGMDPLAMGGAGLAAEITVPTDGGAADAGSVIDAICSRRWA